MMLKNLFLLGDIGFYGMNLRNCVYSISSQIGKQDAVVVLGDNFYPSGLSSMHDIDNTDSFFGKMGFSNNSITMEYINQHNKTIHKEKLLI
jgi:hypothetical protein